VKYLLDTHVWLWLFEASDRFPRHVQGILQSVANVPMGISAISPWEIAKKASLGRLLLSMPARDWIVRSAGNPGICLMPLTPDIAWEANALPTPFHNDPADQIIVATARLHNLTLITSDRKILTYPHVRTLWE
jgi:PIN domain nuclease of toxin-antitoxin system